MGSQMPSLDNTSQINLRDTQGASLFNPANPYGTITNFNSGVVVQANLDEPQAVELAPALQSKKKVKKIKKAKKKEAYLTLDDESQAYGSMTNAKVEHSALQSISLNNDQQSTNPQDNGMMPLDFDPNSNDNKIHGDDGSSHAHQSANPLDNHLIIDQDDGEKADGEDDDDFDFEDARVDQAPNRNNFNLDEDDDDDDLF